MKTSIIIPAFNEVDSFGQVLANCSSHYGLEVLGVDGGSVDGTVALERIQVPE